MAEPFKLGQFWYKQHVLKRFNFELTMAPEFMGINARAKERLETTDHFASDLMNGNVDYHVSFNGWRKRTVFGEVLLAVPTRMISNDINWHEVAADAIRTAGTRTWPDWACGMVMNEKVTRFRSRPKRGR